MNKPPNAAFVPKNAGYTQTKCTNFISPTHLGPVPFHFHYICKVRSHLLCNKIEARRFAVPVIRCRALHRLDNLLKSAYERPKRVAEGYVVSLRV